MSKKKLILHIGLPKTGTSYLQSLLLMHRPRLLAQGTWVSSKPIYAHRFAVEAIMDPDRAGQNDVAAIKATSLTDARADLDRAFADAGIKRLIISSEYFFEGVPERVAALFADYADAEFQIIVYLRRQDRLIESGYNQEVKAMGHRGTPRMPTYTQRLDWWVVLNAWAEVFGAGRVAAIGYDKAAATNTVVQRFFSAIGAAIPDGLSDERPSVNESLPADLLEFKRLANAFGEFGLDKWLYEAVAASEWSGKFRFTREMAGRFVEIYGPSNRHVAEHFFGGDLTELGLGEPIGQDTERANFVGALPVETLAKLLALHMKESMERARSMAARLDKLEAELNSLRTTPRLR